MAATALGEAEIGVFLRRRRREDIPSPQPLGPFLAGMLDLAARLVPCEAGSVLLDDPSQRRPGSPLTFVAAFGPAKDSLVGLSVPPRRGIVGHVYASGRAWVSNRVADDPRFFRRVDELSTFRTRSAIALPLRLEHTVAGVLELVNRRGRRGFGTRDAEVATLIAQTISRGILNAVDLAKQTELVLADELTGLRNVRGLDAAIDAEIARAGRDGEDVCVLFVDVDRLKRVNDRLGHRAGSEALRRVGRALRDACGAQATPFRFGGDEFVVLYPTPGVDEARRLADEIRAEVRRTTRGPMEAGGRLPAVTVSIGVASLDSLSRSRRATGATLGARLLTAADRALYRAKRAGRARTVVATRADDRLGAR